MLPIKELLTELVGFQSVTPHDVGCQDYMITLLESLGFSCQRHNNPPVSNFFAHIGQEGPLLIFAGHTDVVPIGDPSKWHSDPFTLDERDGLLYGRGTADMKGSLACMLIAASRFVKAHPNAAGRLGFLITSGEEGDDFNLGTPYVMEQLHQQGIHPDFCIIGEPSSTHSIGDVIKIGRRGSLTAKLELHGKQGHVAYPHLADNPIHRISPLLLELTTLELDHGNEHFPPTSLQITEIQSSGHASNVIPGELTLQFNIRYSTEQTSETLKCTINECVARHGLKPLIHWRLNGEPFLTSTGQLLDACIELIKKEVGHTPELSTSGGTSDGRFIAPYGVETIELGPLNKTIHQVNEHVALADLNTLTNIYFALCETLLTKGAKQ